MTEPAAPRLSTRFDRLAGIGAGVLRRLVGRDTSVERAARARYVGAKNRIARRHPGPGSLLLWSGRSDRRVGVYMEGSCDLQAVFFCEPYVRGVLRGRCGLKRQGTVDGARSDILLQGLGALPAAAVAEATARLRLAPDYFHPTLFEPTFAIPGPRGPETFRKHVVFLSIGADVARAAYRHRESGLLVDPGGWWLNHSMEDVLADRRAVSWFRETFQSIGRIEVAAFYDNMSRLLPLVRARTGAPVAALNVLVVEPGGRTHNYQFVRDSPEKRRREFNLALVELARRFDFAVLDVDRLLKEAGVRTQIDFNHYGERRLRAIGAEAFEIMRELGLFDAPSGP